jgi:hypothetical protein
LLLLVFAKNVCGEGQTRRTPARETHSVSKAGCTMRMHEAIVQWRIVVGSHVTKSKEPRSSCKT